MCRLQRHFREAELYLLRFQQCMTRAMTLVEMLFVRSLRAPTQDNLSVSRGGCRRRYVRSFVLSTRRHTTSPRQSPCNPLLLVTTIHRSPTPSPRLKINNRTKTYIFHCTYPTGCLLNRATPPPLHPLPLLLPAARPAAFRAREARGGISGGVGGFVAGVYGFSRWFFFR